MSHQTELQQGNTASAWSVRELRRKREPLQAPVHVDSRSCRTRRCLACHSTSLPTPFFSLQKLAEHTRQHGEGLPALVMWILYVLLGEVVLAEAQSSVKPWFYTTAGDSRHPMRVRA